MSAVDHENEEVGGEDNTLLAEETVDESQLKLPSFRWDASHAAEVKSGEEEEEVVYKERCRLFVRSGAEWKERALGDVKLLRHKTSKLVRLIVRQEKTLKLRANHVIAADAVLKTNSGNDKSWVFSANDYSDEEMKHTAFAIRFKDVDLAIAFKEAYEAAREANAKLFASGVKSTGVATPTKPREAVPVGGAGGKGAPAAGGAPITPFASLFTKTTTSPATGTTPTTSAPAPNPFTSLKSGGPLANPFAPKPAATGAGAPVANPFAALKAGGTGTSLPATGGAGASVTTAAPAPAPYKDVSGPVPITDKHAEVYGAAAESDAIIRYGALTTAFRAAFEDAIPTFYVRAPGRVNLIGEHIDYHGYSVLPMALAQDVVIAVGVGSEGGAAGIRVANVNSKYSPATLPLDPTATIDQSAGVTWSQYVQCGYKGAFDAAKDAGVTVAPKALQLMVDGRVPTGAGVSSSSALTVASLLAVSHALGVDTKLTRAGLGEAARKCELYIGTMSGGMDQAIACLAEAGKAARIDFDPLRAVPVTLPPDAAFVVSNTLEEVPKAVDAEKRYNRRVTEGKLAAKLVAKGAGLTKSWSSIHTFRQLQEELKLPSPGALLPLIAKHLKPGAYSVADITAAAGVAPSTLFEGDPKKAGALKVLDSVGKDAKEFMLLQRANHVVSEAERVFAFQAACEGKVRNGDGSTSALEGGSEAQLKAMGKLLTESHASCRDDYECSSVGLDELTALAVANGAYGSRLTGAGWGGCAVSLVHASRVPAFIAAMKAGYYDKRGRGDEASTALFASAPGSGATIINPPTSFEL